jgi:hypothetical protein
MKPLNSIRRLPLILLLVLPCAFSHAGPLDGKSDATTSTSRSDAKTQNTQEAQDASKPFKSRLKFRHGPVCMCADGLSESEIDAALKKRKDKKQ